MLPSRVVVYLLLAAALFAELGYGQVWARMMRGLDGLAGGHADRECVGRRARAGSGSRRCGRCSTCCAARRLGWSTTGVYWRGRLVSAIDGTILCCAGHAREPRRSTTGAAATQGGTGYPMVRVLALVACGTRTIIDAVFGTDRIGETSYAHDLLGAAAAPG